MVLSPTIAIMYDRRRRSRAERLAGQLSGYISELVVMCDGTNGGPWLALSKAIWSGPSDKTHTIVVEDDAVLCKHFVQGALNAIDAYPDEAMYLFASRFQLGCRMLEALWSGNSWCRAHPMRTIGTVAAILPKRIAQPAVEYGYRPDVIRFMQQVCPDKPWTGDSRLWAYYQNEMEGYRPLVLAQSLVQHREDVSGGSSLVGGHGQGEPRESPTFIGSNVSATCVDMSTGIYDPSPQETAPIWKCE